MEFSNSGYGRWLLILFRRERRCEGGGEGRRGRGDLSTSSTCWQRRSWKKESAKRMAGRGASAIVAIAKREESRGQDSEHGVRGGVWGLSLTLIHFASLPNPWMNFVAYHPFIHHAISISIHPHVHNGNTIRVSRLGGAKKKLCHEGVRISILYKCLSMST